VAAGVAQAEVARHIGVTPGCISRWESGQRRPSGPEAARWATLLRELGQYVAGDGARGEVNPLVSP
jgi:DNA-binding transcriptional regulator YiaG